MATAAKNNVPIFAPGLIDSMMGLQLWIFSQDHDFVVDAVADMHYLSDIVFESKKWERFYWVVALQNTILWLPMSLRGS